MMVMRTGVNFLNSNLKFPELVGHIMAHVYADSDNCYNLENVARVSTYFNYENLVAWVR